MGAYILFCLIFALVVIFPHKILYFAICINIFWDMDETHGKKDMVEGKKNDFSFRLIYGNNARS